MDEIETLFDHIDFEYKHLDEIRKNMTYLTRRMGGYNSLNRFSTSSTDVRFLLETYTQLYSVIVHHIENLYDRIGHYNLRRFQRNPSSTSRTTDYENYALINGRYYNIDSTEAERLLNSNNEPNSNNDEASNNSSSSESLVENNLHQNETHEESTVLDSSNVPFHNITPFQTSPTRPRPRQRGPFQSQVLDVQRNVMHSPQPPSSNINAAGAGPSPPGLNREQERTGSPVRNMFRTPPPLWNASTNRPQYTARPPPSTNIRTPLFGAPRNRDIEQTIWDDVDSSFDALVNSVNSYQQQQTRRNVFSSQSNDGSLNSPFFSNLTNELMRSFQEPVIVAPSENQIRESTRNITYSEIEDPMNHQCPISLEIFTPNTVVTQIIHCRHVFMPPSFSRWFSGNVRCPICRYDIRSNVPESTRIRINNERTQSRNHDIENQNNIVDENDTNRNLQDVSQDNDSPRSSPSEESVYNSLEEIDNDNQYRQISTNSNESSSVIQNNNNNNPTNNEVSREINDVIDREIEQQILQDMDIDIDNNLNNQSGSEEESRYSPPPPPYPRRPPPDLERIPPISPDYPNSENPVFNVVRSMLNNNQPEINQGNGPTGLRGSFGGHTGAAAIGANILNNIMESNIQNVRFDPSNNQVQFETTIWDSSWNSQS